MWWVGSWTWVVLGAFNKECGYLQVTNLTNRFFERTKILKLYSLQYLSKQNHCDISSRTTCVLRSVHLAYLAVIVYPIYMQPLIYSQISICPSTTKLKILRICVSPGVLAGSRLRFIASPLLGWTSNVAKGRGLVEVEHDSLLCKYFLFWGTHFYTSIYFFKETSRRQDSCPLTFFELWFAFH